jgi:hypothetical protein
MTQQHDLAKKIEAKLIREGYVPRIVLLNDDKSAQFWVVKQELHICGPEDELLESLPYFEPGDRSDAELAEKVQVYLLFS